MNRERGFAVIATISTLILSLVLPAHAGLTDIEITGTVTDRIGVPLSGVRISDGDSDTLTDADGAFSIDEEIGNGFTLNASKTGLIEDSWSGTALPGTTVNFQLFYILTTQVTPNAFNNSSPTTVNVTTRSFAPPDSCVTWTDVATGTLLTLEHDSNVPGPDHLWRGSFQVSSAVKEGTFLTRTRAADCSNGTHLTEEVGRTYVVDNSPPQISHTIPINETHTMREDQPILIQTFDAGDAGITRDGISFKLLESGGIEAPLALDTYRSSTGWAKTIRPQLTVQKSYTVTATVTDRAGNSSSSTSTFSVIGITLPSVPVAIPDTVSTSSSLDTLSGKRSFTFDNVPVVISPFQATWLGAPAHFGYGHLRQTIPLTSATIQLFRSVDGEDVPIGTPLPAPALWGTRQAYPQFSVLHESSSQIIASPRLEVTIPSLIATIGDQAVVADKAVLSLSASVRPEVPTCNDPTNCGTSYPTTDPIPFLISPTDASAVRNANSRLSAGSDLDVTPGVSSVRQSSSLIYDLQWDPTASHWVRKTQLGGLVDDISYAQSYPVIPPSGFGTICEERLCVGSAPTLHYGDCTESARSAGTCHQILQVAGHVERSLVDGVNKVSTAVSMVGTKGLGSSGVFAELGGSLSGISETAVTGSSQRFYRGRVSGGEECSVESAAATAAGGNQFDLLISDSEGSEVESAEDTSWHRLLLSALDARTVCSVDGTLTVAGSATELAAALVKRSYELPEGTFTGIARWSFAYRGDSASGAWSCRGNAYCMLTDRASESGGWQIDFPQLFLN